MLPTNLDLELQLILQLLFADNELLRKNLRNLNNFGSHVKIKQSALIQNQSGRKSKCSFRINQEFTKINSPQQYRFNPFKKP